MRSTLPLISWLLDKACSCCTQDRVLSERCSPGRASPRFCSPARVVQIARVFKVLCAALLAYVAVLFLINIPWQTVAVDTVVPHIQLSSAYIALLVAGLGTTILPYLFFLQAMHRVEDMQEEDLGGERAVPLRHRTRRAGKSK